MRSLERQDDGHPFPARLIALDAVLPISCPDVLLRLIVNRAERSTIQASSKVTDSFASSSLKCLVGTTSPFSRQC